MMLLENEWIKEMFLKSNIPLHCIPDDFNCETWKAVIAKRVEYEKQETANRYKALDQMRNKESLITPADMDLTHLTDFGIPVNSPNAMECVLRSIVKINDYQPDPNSDGRCHANGCAKSARRAHKSPTFA